MPDLGASGRLRFWRCQKMKRIVRKLCSRESIVMFFIIFGVQGFWMTLELLFYGEVQPRVVDNFIGAMLFLSLYANYRNWEAR